MEKTGVLNMELVDHVFSEFCQQGVIKEDILEMMMKFGLIVQFTLSPTEKKYFVPCQLRSPADIPPIKEPSPGDPCPLYLDFQGMGYVPHGLYVQLVSRCIKWCSTSGFKEPPELYDGTSLFFIGKKLTHRMMLECKKRFIKIVLRQMKRNDGSSYEPVSAKEVPILVRKFLNEMMQNLLETLPWLKNVVYELCVKCPYCLKVKNHVIIIANSLATTSAVCVLRPLRQMDLAGTVQRAILMKFFRFLNSKGGSLAAARIPRSKVWLMR